MVIEVEQCTLFQSNALPLGQLSGMDSKNFGPNLAQNLFIRGLALYYITPTMSKALHFGNVIHIIHIATWYDEYHWNRHHFNSPLIAATEGGFNFLNEPKESFRMRGTIETHCCLSPCLTCILREVLYYPMT